MKTGFQIKIQSNLSESDLKKAIDYADEFIISTLKDLKKRYNGDNSKGGFESYYKRGIYGYEFNKGNLTFRRISSKKRIFGIVKIDMLEFLNPECEKYKCICFKCRGGAEVKWKNLPDFFVYATVGEIKG